MNEYIKRIDDAARENLRRIATAQRDLKRAERLMKEATASRDERRMLNAKSHLMDCQDEVRNARKDAERVLDGLRHIRAEAVDAAVTRTAVNPDAIDTNTMELLKLGICAPSDMAVLAKRFSNNVTMTRIIGKFAADAAEAIGDKNQTARIAYSTVAVNCADSTNPNNAGADVDSMLDIFKRSINNPAMIPEYDALSAPITGVTNPGNPLSNVAEK